MRYLFSKTSLTPHLTHIAYKRLFQLRLSARRERRIALNNCRSKMSRDRPARVEQPRGHVGTAMESKEKYEFGGECRSLT
jgi:hypothetical protein